MDIFWVLVLMYIAISKSLGHDEQIGCSVSAKKPSEESLKRKYNEYLQRGDDIHSTFDLIPPLYKSRYGSNIEESKQILRYRIYGRAKCLKKLNRTSENIMDISLCPWFVEMTYDTERYPEYIANARCTCKHCYNSNGRRPAKSRRVESPLCKEIKQRFKVLRIKQNGQGDPACDNDSGIYSYEDSYEEVTIGCTCALKQDKTVEDLSIKTEQ